MLDAASSRHDQTIFYAAGTSASEPMPLPSGSDLNGEPLGAGAQSYQTPGNSLHGASPASFSARERGRRDSLGTSMGTPLISPSRNRRDSLGASQGTPMLSPNANGNRRPELGRSDGPRQRTAPRTGRRREPSVPMSQIDDPEVRLCPSLSLPHPALASAPRSASSTSPL